MTVHEVAGAGLSPPCPAGPCVVLGRAWCFIHSSFPVMQLQSESGRSFQCGGILGNWKGLGLKAAQTFVQWTLLKARGWVPYATF